MPVKDFDRDFPLCYTTAIKQGEGIMAGYLHITHITYDPNIAGYCFLRFSGNPECCRAMKEELKHIARQHGISYGYTYTWDSSYQWDVYRKGAWYVHWVVARSILNGFDNREEATKLYQNAEQAAAIHFEALRKTQLEERLRQKEQEARAAADQAERDARAKQKLQDLLNTFLQDYPPPEVISALAVLGLNRDCSEDAAKIAYRVLAKRYHTDNGGDAERIVAINNARDTLFLWKGWKKRQPI